jgi:hypothetical protein
MQQQQQQQHMKQQQQQQEHQEQHLEEQHLAEQQEQQLEEQQQQEQQLEEQQQQEQQQQQEAQEERSNAVTFYIFIKDQRGSYEHFKVTPDTRLHTVFEAYRRARYPWWRHIDSLSFIFRGQRVWDDVTVQDLHMKKDAVIYCYELLP